MPCPLRAIKYNTNGERNENFSKMVTMVLLELLKRITAEFKP